MMYKEAAPSRHFVALWFLLLLFLLPAHLPAQAAAPARNHAGMAATAHPLATRAALEMMQQGGNAMDAAIAAAFAIGVVEPDGSGLGGGGGLIYYDARRKQGYAIDYYQRTSAHVDSIHYDRRTDRFTAKEILVPGNVAGLVSALQMFGTLPLRTVLQPAIRHAANGFCVDETLAQIILDHVELLQKYPETASLYLPDGFPLMTGDTLRQPGLAKTLTRIAENGRSAFYEGPVARALVEEVTRLGGAMTLDDFKSYEARLTEPAKGSYRGYCILSAQAPLSGPSVIQALNMLESVDLKSMGHYQGSPATLHLMAEVFRRVYADRSAYVEDPQFAPVPVATLISKDYARERFVTIDLHRPVPQNYRHTPSGEIEMPDRLPQREAAPEPVPLQMQPHGPALPVFDDAAWPGASVGEDVTDDAAAMAHTTHLSVIDKEGNTVSLTQTLGTFFGSGLVIEGVLLNASLANFSETSRVNALAPGKRPRTTIAPTIILKEDLPFLSIGSPGAGRIISTMVEVISNIIDFGMNLQQANDAPRFHCQKFDDYLHLEDRIPAAVRDDLTGRGHRLRLYGPLDLYFGGVQMVQYDVESGLFLGSADRRRGGTAGGE